MQTTSQNSKFLAERLVLDAIAHHGLNAKVMRVGNLAPRSYDGEFQANFNSNSYMGRLKVFNTLGCCTYDNYDELTEMSPINETAKAVVLSAMLAYEDMTHGQKAAIIDRDNRYTCAVLHRLGFHWSDTAWDYVERMLTAISGFDYFETK